MTDTTKTTKPETINQSSLPSNPKPDKTTDKSAPSGGSKGMGGMIGEARNDESRGSMKGER